MDKISNSITERVCNDAEMIMLYCLKPVTQLSYALKTIGHILQVCTILLFVKLLKRKRTFTCVKLGYILPNTDKYGDGRQKQTVRPAGIVSLHCNRKK